MDSDNNYKPREMFKGNWECSGCGTAITELPFEPDPSRTGELVCRDCHKKKKDSAQTDRKMFEGSWSCSKCGGEITSLPFEPDPNRDNTLQCRDCFRK